jgi:glycosyltransferase involved in cell wall biosynthesis
MSSTVCHVVPYYPPHLGGTEGVAETLATSLADGHDVVVLTSAAPQRQPSTERPRPRLTVRRLWAFEVARTPVMPTLWRHLRRLPKDALVHVHVGVAYASEVVWIWSLVSRRQYVAHFHLDVDPTSPRLAPFFSVYKRQILGRVLRRAAYVIAVSPDQPQFLVSEYGLDETRIVHIPNGVSAAFRVEDREPPLSTRPFRWLSVGRLAAQKNQALLLHAAAGMTTTDVELVIVGDGEDRSALEKLRDQLGLTRVRFVGSAQGDELVKWYRWADAFVLTSVKESTGIVLLEAFMAGLPVVATDVQGVRDTVGRDGVLVKPTAGSMAEALDAVTRDREFWKDLAARSARRATEHSWEPSLGRLQELYRSVRAARPVEASAQ